MVSQSDFSYQSLGVFEDIDLGGYTKTQNEPPDRIQRRNLTHRGARTSYRVDVNLSTCVHGYLDASKQQRASLIILEAQFASVGDGRHRFRCADMSLEFSDDYQAPSKPDVIAYAPFRFQEQSDPTAIGIEEEKQVAATASGGGPGGSAGVNFSASKKMSYQMRYFDRGTAGTFHSIKNNTRDGVWWNLQESLNPKQKDGIRANCLFAVVLTRESEAPFTGDFQLVMKAGTWYNIQEIWKETTGRAIPDDPINFDPTSPPQGTTTGITADQLGRYTDNRELEKLLDSFHPGHRLDPASVPASNVGAPLGPGDTTT